MLRFCLSVLLIGVSVVATLCAQSLNERMNTFLASPKDTHQVRNLTSLCDSFKLSMQDIPAVLFEGAFALANELNDERGLAQLYSLRYVNHLGAGRMEAGLSDIAQVKKYARVTGQTEILRRAFLNEALFLMINGETVKAANKASDMAQYFRKSGDIIGEAGAYTMLATLSAGFSNATLSTRYDSLAISLARSSTSRMTECIAISTAGMNKCIVRDYERALPLAEEALIIARELNDEREVRNALSVRAEANTALGNYAAALKDFEHLSVGETKSKSTWRMTNKGTFLQRIGRHDEARELLHETIKIIKKTSNDPLELRRGYRALQTVGLNQAQYDTVVWYGNYMDAQRDSLQTVMNMRNLLELEEKYKAQQKEDQIRIQEEELALRRYQLYGTGFFLLLALGVGLVFYQLNRSLRKRNAENELLVADKETLVGEIHHRVKNNLQVVSSLLQIQRRGLDSNNEKGREALLESQNRVSAMGLIHNKLYQGEEVTSVHMPDYLKDLGETLLDAYRLEEHVDIFYDIEDLWLDVDTAIPLGLIINELITNSLKYAFPAGREGTIELSFGYTEELGRLVVIDDGVGATAAAERADSTSFGNNLIGLLSQKLKGTLRVLDVDGYGVEIIFDKRD